MTHNPLYIFEVFFFLIYSPTNLIHGEKKKKRKTCFRLKLATVKIFIAITFGVVINLLFV